MFTSKSYAMKKKSNIKTAASTHQDQYQESLLDWYCSLSLLRLHQKKSLLSQPSYMNNIDFMEMFLFSVIF